MTRLRGKVKMTRTGFTLVELLVSMGLLVIMGAVLAEVFTSAAQVAIEGRAYGDIYRAGRVVTRRVTRDLSGLKTEGGYLFLSLVAYDNDNDGWVEELRGGTRDYGDLADPLPPAPEFLVKGLPKVDIDANGDGIPDPSDGVPPAETPDGVLDHYDLVPGSSVLVFYAATSDVHAGGTVFYALTRGQQVIRNGEIWLDDAGRLDLIRGVDPVNTNAATIDFQNAIIVAEQPPPLPPVRNREAYVLATNVLSFKAHCLPRYDRDNDGQLGNTGDPGNPADTGDWVLAWHPTGPPGGAVDWAAYYGGQVAYNPGDLAGTKTVAPRAVQIDLVITNDRRTFKDEQNGNDGVGFHTEIWVPAAP